MSDILARALATQNARRTGPFVYNGDIGLRRWRAALARVKAGTNQLVNVCVCGDSITEGLNAGAGPADYPTKGYVGRFRSALAAKYGDVGTGMIPVFHPTGAPLWTFTGSGWTNTTSWFGCGGLSKQSITNGDTATFTFSGTGVGVVYPKRSDAGTFTISVDGGGPVAVDSYNAGDVHAVVTEVTGLANGSHTCVITSTVTGGKKIWLHGFYPIKGAAGVRVNMVGRSGVTAGTASTVAAMPAEIDIWSPTLSILAFTANDYTGGTPLGTYKAGLQAMIDRALTFGDVLLLSTGLRTEAGAIPQKEYAAVQLELAMQNSVAFLDVFNRWSGDANYAKTTLGFIADNVHPNDYGHQDIATALINVLLEER